MKTHKIIRVLLLSIFFFVQILFLGFSVKELSETFQLSDIFFVLIGGLTLLLGYCFLKLNQKDVAYENIAVALWIPIGAIVCYILNISLGLGSVLAAGIVGGIASFTPMIKKQSSHLKKLPVAIYCGAFVGMSSVQIAPSMSFVIAAGFFAAIIYILAKNLFVGIGGKLGTIAFIGVIIATLINWI